MTSMPKEKNARHETGGPTRCENLAAGGRAAEIDVEARIIALGVLTTSELRIEWRRLFRATPPTRLSRNLLLRGMRRNDESKGTSRSIGSCRGTASRTAMPPTMSRSAMPTLRQSYSATRLPILVANMISSRAWSSEKGLAVRSCARAATDFSSYWNYAMLNRRLMSNRVTGPLGSCRWICWSVRSTRTATSSPSGKIVGALSQCRKKCCDGDD